jgi:AraC-like DNA-binding protein
MTTYGTIYSTVQVIALWIEADIARPMNIEMISEKSGYSKSHFQRVFKLMTDYTVMGYIRGRRLTIAATLLKTTDLLVSEIYSQVGYTEGTDFCRAFKAHFGVSASEFRASSDDFSEDKVDSYRPTNKDY